MTTEAIMRVDWNEDDHALGYDVIDTGHRLVADAVINLRVLRGAATVRTILAMLDAQLTVQFHHEESVMMVTRSANLADHVHEHRRMLDVVTDLRRRADAGDDVGDDLLLNLTAFLESHLRGTDVEEFATPPYCRWVA